MTRAGLVEAGMIVAFAVLFLVIGAPFLAHTIVGTAFAVLGAVHLWQRRDRVSRTRLIAAALLAGLVAVLVSGAFQLAGHEVAAPWHGGLSWVLTIALAVHVWRERRALRHRLRALRGKSRPRGERRGR
jgi:hypothetical protein